MATDSKLCKGCGKLTPKSDFVSVYGQANPRGKYCMCCYLARERQHVMSLMDGRDFCLYCGKKIGKYCDYDENGRSVMHYMELDHMDPVALGGHDVVGLIDLETGESLDDGQNTVYCCRECNRAKKHKPFIEWVESLTPECKEFAIAVYKQKHEGKSPDEFRSDIPPDIQIDFD
jgi:HNH endonuclease